MNRALVAWALVLGGAAWAEKPDPSRMIAIKSGGGEIDITKIITVRTATSIIAVDVIVNNLVDPPTADTFVVHCTQKYIAELGLIQKALKEQNLQETSEALTGLLHSLGKPISPDSMLNTMAEQACAHRPL